MQAAPTCPKPPVPVDWEWDFRRCVFDPLFGRTWVNYRSVQHAFHFGINVLTTMAQLWTFTEVVPAATHLGPWSKQKSNPYQWYTLVWNRESTCMQCLQMYEHFIPKMVSRWHNVVSCVQFSECKRSHQLRRLYWERITKSMAVTIFNCNNSHNGAFSAGVLTFTTWGTQNKVICSYLVPL